MKQFKMKFLNRAVAFMVAVLTVSFCTIRADAVEFSVTRSETVMYTNEETVIYADADENTAVIMEIEADLPIQVLGTTSNGYFQIWLGDQIFYVNGTGLYNGPADSQDSTNTASIYERLIAMKEKYPEKMRWTNENYYAWNGGYYGVGYGCAGFAFALSDAAFGDAKATRHTDYSNIRVGDILSINNNTHFVIVLEVRENSVIVAEGNYNGSVHWGREIAKSALQGEGCYILTRY